MTINSAAAVFCWVIYFVGEKFLMIIITADTSISSLCPGWVVWRMSPSSLEVSVPEAKLFNHQFLSRSAGTT